MTITRRVAMLVAGRWQIARLAPSGGWALILGTGGFNLVLGALPVVFLVASSILLGRIPAAAADGTGSAAWQTMVAAFVVTTAALLVQQLFVPLQTALNDFIARRVDGLIFQRLMTAALSGVGIEAMEDQDALDDLGEASRELTTASAGPGAACAGLLALISRYVQLAGFTVAVGLGFSWLAAAGVAGTTLLFRYGQRGGLRKYSAVFPRLAGHWREANYLREVSTAAAAGKEIRVFGLADWLTRRYREAYLNWILPVWAERRRIYLKPFLGFTAFGLLVTTAVIAVLGSAAAHHSLSLTGLVLVTQAVLAVLRLGDYYPEADVQTQFGMNAYDALCRFEARVASQQRQEPATGSDKACLSCPAHSPPAQHIRFEDVTFRYAGRQEPVFEGLNLTIPVGRTTAVVGSNGVGKTTLVKLLTRLYEPTAGAIYADRTDIRGIPADEWRRHFGVIFQDFVHFEASAADNIGFGAVDFLGDRYGITEAARLAGAADVLADLPSGLDTPLAGHLKGGADLSGGQWQRVAIARALFALRHGASILVLDEPTASLDARAEIRFYTEFVNLIRGRTTILISHRFASVRLADSIVVLADGRVLEQGSHDELLCLGGQYAELFRLQAMRFAGEGPGEGHGTGVSPATGAPE